MQPLNTQDMLGYMHAAWNAYNSQCSLVFCDTCPSLATARFEDDILCTTCLMEAVEKQGIDDNQITPLNG